jgi:hypothetical protein
MGIKLRMLARRGMAYGSLSPMRYVTYLYHGRILS